MTHSHKKNKIFNPGDLVKIKLNGLTYTENGFVACPRLSAGFSVFRFIDIESYPSCNDFKGEKTIIEEDDLALIVRYTGRPMRIIKDPTWFLYDIYEIIVKGHIRQIFLQNLSAI